MKPNLFRQIAVIVSVLATIIINSLANILPFNGQNTGEISDRFPVLFTPAGYVFSIWSVIYLGLIALAIYQALPAQRENPRLKAAMGPLAWSGVANIAWIFLWHYNQFTLSIIAMLALLVLLIITYLRLEIGERPVSTAEKWAARVPVSIYLGWITVATIANASVVLYNLGWRGAPLSQEAWTVIMLAVAALVTGLVLYTRRDVAYALVIVWATVGIAIKQAGTGLVPSAALAVAVLVAILVVATLLRVLPKGRLKAAIAR